MDCNIHREEEIECADGNEVLEMYGGSDTHGQSKE